jgi:hypothetical protein
VKSGSTKLRRYGNGRVSRFLYATARRLLLLRSDFGRFVHNECAARLSRICTRVILAFQADLKRLGKILKIFSRLGSMRSTGPGRRLALSWHVEKPVCADPKWFALAEATGALPTVAKRHRHKQPNDLSRCRAPMSRTQVATPSGLTTTSRLASYAFHPTWLFSA